MPLLWAGLEMIYCLLFFAMHARRLSAQILCFMTSFQQKRLFLLFTLDLTMLIHLFCLQLPAEILKHRALQGWQCTATNRQTLIKLQHAGMKGPTRVFQFLQGPKHPHFLQRTKTQASANFWKTEAVELFHCLKHWYKSKVFFTTYSAVQPARKKEIDCKGESMIYISKTTWDMFKGNEDAEAGNTKRQVVVRLENLSFLWIPSFLISALHLFTMCIPVLTTSCAC